MRPFSELIGLLSVLFLLPLVLWFLLVILGHADKADLLLEKVIVPVITATIGAGGGYLAGKKGL